jgi:site-specific recombinase XerD
MRNPRGLFTVQVRSELRECLNLWLDTVTLKTESKHTVCVYARVVSRFLEYLEAQGIDTLDAVEPCHLRAYLLARKQSGEGKHWLRLRDRALILLLLDTGLRIHEAHNLTVGDAKQEVLLTRGKGSKQRVVFLSAEVRLALRKYLQACPFPLQENSLLWWGRAGALTLYSLMDCVERVGKRAGLDRPLGAHAFRRTFATWSLVLVAHRDAAGRGLVQKLGDACPESIGERVQVLQLPVSRTRRRLRPPTTQARV